MCLCLMSVLTVRFWMVVVVFGRGLHVGIEVTHKFSKVPWNMLCSVCMKSYTCILSVLGLLPVLVLLH